MYGRDLNMMETQVFPSLHFSSVVAYSKCVTHLPHVVAHDSVRSTTETQQQQQQGLVLTHFQLTHGLV